MNASRANGRGTTKGPDSMRKTLSLVIGVLLVAASCGGDNPRGGPGVSGAGGETDATATNGGNTAGSSDTTGSDNTAGGSDTTGSDNTVGGSDTTGSDTTAGSGDTAGGSDTTGSGDTAGSSDTAGSGDTTGSGDTVIDLGAADVVLTAGLVRFDGCDALLDYLHAEYSARVGPWGFGDGGWIGPVPFVGPAAEMADEDMVAEAASADVSTAPAGAGAAGPEFSGTNVQEQGVDEADIVKTDGERIFTLSSGRLVVVDAAARSVIGSVSVAEGWGRELFIDGDSLLVIAHSYSEESRSSEVVLQRIDTSGGVPVVTETLNVQGSYVSARSVDGVARVIMRFDPHQNFPFVHPQNDNANDVAEAANRAAVLNSTLDDWLPHYTFGSADSSTGSRLTSCADAHAPSVFSGFGVTTVLNVPLDGGFDPSSSTAVMAPGDTVYASAGSLYVATTRWLDAADFGDDTDWTEDVWRRAWTDRRTSIHRFDISGAEASYEASGEVLGVIRNQFSLSEHDGFLRVVTTVGDPWGDSESQVRVLSTDGDVLVEVGSVGDIGRGEQVQSVRFAGAVGYVVTFRQIDPFYTVDLSDPFSPAILGELKIPGFSSYLHPISDTLVLGVGSDADPQGRVTGSKVSLFDVSDLSAPREVSVWSAPDGWNDIGWDHRAFLWWAPESLAVIPVRVGNEWSGAVVLRVSDGAVVEVGRVDHVDEGEAPGVTACRRLTADDLPTTAMEDFTTEIEYMIVDGYGAVLACEPGEVGMSGFRCYDEPYLIEEVGRLDVLRGSESISVCWPDEALDIIVRSIVIGDDLWTLGFKGWGGFDGSSRARLQVNDLLTLERLAALEL